MIIAIFRSRVAKEHAAEFKKDTPRCPLLWKPFLVTEAMRAFLPPTVKMFSS